MKFYICSICGNLIETVEDSGMTPSCCNRMMTELKPGSTDGALEKHVPVITIKEFCDGVHKVIVEVGAAPHPMEDMHHIQFICLETDKGNYRKSLDISNDPCAQFMIPASETVIAAYSYCNLHGLWTTNKPK